MVFLSDVSCRNAFNKQPPCSLHFSIFQVDVNLREHLKDRTFITKAGFYGQIAVIKQQHDKCLCVRWCKNTVFVYSFNLCKTFFQ